jgi:transcriptional regulator with XRE-family HTH domain
MDDTDSFGVRLKLARIQRNLDQAGLAALSGLTASAISHFESDRRSPSFTNLKRLARALSVSTDFLLGTVTQMNLGVAGDPLYRHMETLSGRDREYVELFVKALAEKNHVEPED